MAIIHLDVLKRELPQLFQDREPDPFGGNILDENDGGFDVRRVRDVERITNPPGEKGNRHDEAGTLDLPVWKDDWDEILKRVGVERIREEVSGEPPRLPAELVERIGNRHPGGPVGTTERRYQPPPDALAFYLPFHYYGPKVWGIYLYVEGVAWLAGEIYKWGQGRIGWPDSEDAARLFLFYHEAFHHKSECFCTRLELTHRTAQFTVEFVQLYQKTWGTSQCVEEGLANAAAMYDVDRRMKNPLVNDALAEIVRQSPPGYNRGNEFRSKFRDVRCEFAETIQNTCLPSIPPADPNVWKTAQQMFHPMATIKSRVNYLISRDSPLTRLPFRP